MKILFLSDYVCLNFNNQINYELQIYQLLNDFQNFCKKMKDRINFFKRYFKYIFFSFIE